MKLQCIIGFRGDQIADSKGITLRQQVSYTLHRVFGQSLGFTRQKSQNN